MRPISIAAAITARWPRWTPSKFPIATTVPLGIAAGGVVSRIMVKAGVIARILQLVGRGPDRDVAAPPKSSRGLKSGGHVYFSGGGRLTGCLRADASGVGSAAWRVGLARACC